VAREAMKRTPPVEPKARESGSGPVRRDPATSKPPPPPPSANRFEPLPLGANAFAPPVFTTLTTEEEPKRLRKAMPWLVLAGIAGVSGLAVWVTMIINQPPSKDDADERAAAAKVANEASAPAKAKLSAQVELPAATVVVEQPVPEHAAAAAAAAAAVAPAAEASAQAEDKDAAGTPAERDAAREKRHAARAAKAAASASGGASKLPAAPSRTDVLEAMARVHSAVVRCMDGAHGVVTADMKILSSGRVASANISGAPPNAGSCIAGAVRKAKFPEFSAASIAVRYPMKL
jgi:hypothetical protein